jgi:integrase
LSELFLRRPTGKKMEDFYTAILRPISRRASHVAPSTQNQAMNALVFLYKHVLELPLDKRIDAIRATPRKNLPVVMTREEVVRVLAFLEGTPQLVVKLLYGSGLRIAEAVRLRITSVAGTRGHFDNNDLYACAEARWTGGAQSAG